MGQKELLRGKALDVGKQGKKMLKAAAVELKIICRQGIRLLRAYQEGGDARLIHSLSGRPSSRKTAETGRKRAVEFYRKRYGDFGPTFAAEKMAEEAGLKSGRAVGTQAEEPRIPE